MQQILRVAWALSAKVGCGLCFVRGASRQDDLDVAPIATGPLCEGEAVFRPSEACVGEENIDGRPVLKHDLRFERA